MTLAFLPQDVVELNKAGLRGAPSQLARFVLNGIQR